MPAIELNIVEPQNNTFFTPPASVSFRGAAEVPEEITDKPIYFRWYSSFFETSVDRYSMNETAITSADAFYSHELSMGTHIITFAASDVEGESTEEFTTIEYGGVTGGVQGDGQCLVHIVKANILYPADLSTDVTHASVQLQAEAPSKWAIAEKLESGATRYVKNDDYHAVNRLQYRWIFEPVIEPAEEPAEEPDERPVVEFIASPDDLLFQPATESDPLTTPTRVIWTVALPDEAVGLYIIKLIVEDRFNENTTQHSEQITVTLI